MKKVVVFTGAGISAESGIPTFRDTNNGLWYNYNVDEVATIEGWRKDKEKVLDFHNILRAKLKEYNPNAAHLALAELEKTCKVTIITQNIDNLHERAGSTNILHLHGELYKSRSSKNPELLYECLGDIKLGDKCELGSQLRPHTVLFGEMPYNIDEAYEALMECDYLIIIGTSLQISYTLQLLRVVHNSNPKIFYIDPKPFEDIKWYINLPIQFIKKTAVKGVSSLIRKIVKEIKKDNESDKV
jgi:NAD-dependent deacetylase